MFMYEDLYESVTALFFSLNIINFIYKALSFDVDTVPPNVLLSVHLLSIVLKYLCLLEYLYSVKSEMFQFFLVDQQLLSGNRGSSGGRG